MATAPILWADSFGSQDFTAYYAGGGSVVVGGGRAGRNACSISANSLGMAFPSSQSVWILNTGFKNIFVNNIATLAGLAIAVVSGGFLYVGGHVTSTPIPIGAWCHLAVRVYIHPSAGAIDVWLNNTNIMSLTGLNTGSAPTNTVLFNVSLSQEIQLSDLIIQGSDTASDTPVGDVAVIWGAPSGAGANTGFTPSAGANYQCVDESPPNGDTDYISSNVPSTKDTYPFPDLPAATTAVYAVVPKWSVEKIDAGVRTVAPVLRVGGTDYEGTGQAPGMAYLQAFQVYEQSPATASAWSTSEVNGTEVGVEVAT